MFYCIHNCILGSMQLGDTVPHQLPRAVLCALLFIYVLCTNFWFCYVALAILKLLGLGDAPAQPFGYLGIQVLDTTPSYTSFINFCKQLCFFSFLIFIKHLVKILCFYFGLKVYLNFLKLLYPCKSKILFSARHSIIHLQPWVGRWEAERSQVQGQPRQHSKTHL